MIQIKRVEIYSDNDNKRVPPKIATKVLVYIMDGAKIINRYTVFGTFNDTQKSHIKVFYENKSNEGDELPVIEDIKEATEEFVELEHPREEDGKFTDKGSGKKRKSKNTPKMRSRKLDGERKHNLKTYPNTKVVISDATDRGLVTIFENFWNNDPSVKAIRKHVDYIGLLHQKNPKNGGYWVEGEKKVVIHDGSWQTPSHFKSTVVHEIVGHAFWDLQRIYNRDALIEFNELANKMPPINQYCKDNEEKWKSWNDEKRSQNIQLDKKYGLTEDSEVEYTLYGDELDKWQADYNKIEDNKYIGNPSNEHINRDSSSMTRYANEQHSAITEIMYGTTDGSFEEGAQDILIGEENLERMKTLWKKIHPKFPSSEYFKLSEVFDESEHPREEDGKFTDKGSSVNDTSVNDTSDTTNNAQIPSDKNYRIEARKLLLQSKIDSINMLINKGGLSVDNINMFNKNILDTQSEYDELEIKNKTTELPFIPMGKNTHHKKTNGFVTNKTKIMLSRTVTDDVYDVYKNEGLKTMWNALPDDVRDNISVLKINKSRARPNSKYVGGMWINKEKKMIINLHERSSYESIAHHFYHEVGHSRWHTLIDTHIDKINKFIESQKVIGFAPTKYAEKYRNAVYHNNEQEKKYRARMKRGGFTISEKSESILSKNRIESELLYYNEIHSELNAYIMGELPSKHINITSNNMKRSLDAYKELWNL